MGDYQNDRSSLRDTTLRSLVSSINASLDSFESANDPIEKSSALASIAQNSQKLKNASTPPADAFADFTFQPLANACVRIALSMGLFDHLPQNQSAGSSVEQLATLTETDPTLTVRIVRGLVAFNVVHQDDASGLYSHTPMSLIYADPQRRSWAIWMWDVMAQAATRGIAPYFDGHSKPISNPTDPQNAPFNVAHDLHDMDVFEVVKAIGKLPLMSSAMSGSSVVCAKEAVASFDFASLAPGNDEVVLVDVGGAKGQTILEIRRANPALKGKIVLQDLQSVLDDGSLPDLDAEIMPYDFFKQDQPVKGAAAYLYQRIFHDWSDDNAKKILDSLKQAMASHSKLLICDVVVPDYRPHPRKVMRDLNMLLVGGMERSQEQWRALLEGNGFVIETFHGLDNLDNSIIEARLK